MIKKQFAAARGQVIDTVAFSSDTEFHIFTLRFMDKTVLAFRIEPRFTFRAGYSDWKTGDEQILEEWAPISSVSSADVGSLGTSIIEWHTAVDIPPMHIERYKDESWLQSESLLLMNSKGKIAIGYCQQPSEEQEAEFEPDGSSDFGKTIKWAILPSSGDLT